MNYSYILSIFSWILFPRVLTFWAIYKANRYGKTVKKKYSTEKNAHTFWRPSAVGHKKKRWLRSLGSPSFAASPCMSHHLIISSISIFELKLLSVAINSFRFRQTMWPFYAHDVCIPASEQIYID